MNNMKRVLLLIISTMLFFPTVTDAQIKKTGTFKAETIESVRMGIVSLKLADGEYYLCFTTTNQFDDLMVLKLGETKESAIQSLQDIIEILDGLQGNATQFIDNGYGREFRLSKVMGALYISADGYAGNGNTSKGELKKFLKALQ